MVSGFPISDDDKHFGRIWPGPQVLPEHLCPVSQKRHMRETPPHHEGSPDSLSSLSHCPVGYAKALLPSPRQAGVPRLPSSLLNFLPHLGLPPHSFQTGNLRWNSGLPEVVLEPMDSDGEAL